MRKFTAWVSIVCLIGVVGIGLLRAAQPTRDQFAQSRQVLESGNCPMPCVMGIRPGVTTMQAAQQLLHDNPAIDPKSLQLLAPDQPNGTFTANWRVPAAMLAAIPPNNAAQAIIVENAQGQDVVSMVVIQINIPLGDFLPLFGSPQRTALRHDPGPAGDLFYVMEYPALGMQYDTRASCQQGQVVSALIGQTYV